MNDPHSVTGIPIEYLFLIIGSLVSLLYMDLRRALRLVLTRGAKRDILLAKICAKLGIEWDGE